MIGEPSHVRCSQWLNGLSPSLHSIPLICVTWPISCSTPATCGSDPSTSINSLDRILEYSMGSMMVISNCQNPHLSVLNNEDLLCELTETQNQVSVSVLSAGASDICPTQYKYTTGLTRGKSIFARAYCRSRILGSSNHSSRHFRPPWTEPKLLSGTRMGSHTKHPSLILNETPIYRIGHHLRTQQLFLEMKRPEQVKHTLKRNSRMYLLYLLRLTEVHQTRIED